MMAPDTIDAPEIWVVFSDNTELAYLWFLKPGFRHCFIIIRNEADFISYDPLSNYTEILNHKLPEGFALEDWLVERGCKVIKTSGRRDIKRPAPPMIFTCVEAVKRVLGLHCMTILTPWQLYRHLKKQQICQKKEIKNGKSHFTTQSAQSHKPASGVGANARVGLNAGA